MFIAIPSNIMTRTTLDLDPSVLRDLKDRGRREGKSLGQVASEVLAQGLPRQADPPDEPLDWTARAMGARVDLSDKDTVYRELDAPTGRS